MTVGTSRAPPEQNKRPSQSGPPAGLAAAAPDGVPNQVSLGCQPTGGRAESESLAVHRAHASQQLQTFGPHAERGVRQMLAGHLRQPPPHRRTLRKLSAHRQEAVQKLCQNLMGLLTHTHTRAWSWQGGADSDLVEGGGGDGTGLTLVGHGGDEVLHDAVGTEARRGGQDAQQGRDFQPHRVIRFLVVESNHKNDVILAV